MAITECGRGHVYDTDQYAFCPYCNGTSNIINFGNGNEVGRTTSPGMTGQMPQRGGFEELGKTVAPESFRKAMEQENKTVAVFQKRTNLDPVVGWLVCTKGPEKGKDYRLWSRINSIGRGDNMDVCIKDTTISKENHARLAYDIKHNNFRLIPGNSTNTIYLNDEPVYVPVLIKAFDIIEFGESKVIFVPLCCEHFTWLDEEKKDD